MDPQQLERLKQQASERYLAGDYGAALAGWQQVLAHQPDDAHAIEGVRMCSLMTGAQPPPAGVEAPNLEIDLEMPVETPGASAAREPESPRAPHVPELEVDLALDAARTAQPGPALENEIDSHLSVLGGDAPPAPAATPSVPPALSAVASEDEMTLESQGTASTSGGAAGPDPAHELPDPDRQAGGIDFGDEPVETLQLAGEVPADEPRRGLIGLNELEPEAEIAGPAPTLEAPAAQAPSAPPSTAESADTMELSFEIDEAALAAPPAGSDPAPAESDPAPAEFDPAAAELQERVRELLDEARAARAAGDSESAAGVLSRVFILDEENQEAMELQRELSMASDEVSGEQIEDWLNEATQLLGRGELVEARERFEQVLLAQPGHVEAEHGLEQIDAAEGNAPPDDPAPTPPPELQDVARALSHVPSALEEGTEAVPLVAVSSARAGASIEAETGFDAAQTIAVPLPSRSGGKLPRLLVAVLLLAAAGGAAWWAVPRYLDRDAEEPETAAAAPADPRPGASEGTDAADVLAAATTAATAAPAVAAPVNGEEVLQSLNQARGAYESGDYEAAVLAYSHVLELDPKNPEARDGLEQAGELYRTEQKEREQFKRARIAFDDGSYASALRLFYRVPDTVEPELVQSYLVAGWYNMGLTSLKGGDCDEAVAHFDEALAIRPDDGPSLQARQYAARYQVEPRDSDFYRSVETMEFRTVQ